MPELTDLLENNKAWAQLTRLQDPDFFPKLSRQQAPQYLWIGCSDSRVPANQIVGLLPGELFVHRNVANLVVHTDLNCLSVLQYAVEVLQVRHVIVCGHYGCGGVKASGEEAGQGLIDNWLRHIQDVAEKHRRILSRVQGSPAALDRLCELNVIEQAANVCRTTIVRDAWRRGAELAVHSWIYSIKDGLVRDLRFSTAGQGRLDTAYERALGMVADRC